MLFLATDLIYCEIIKSLLVQVLHALHSFPILCPLTHLHTHSTRFPCPVHASSFINEMSWGVLSHGLCTMVDVTSRKHCGNKRCDHRKDTTRKKTAQDKLRENKNPTQTQSRN